jgi:hypothetical protein
VDVSLDTNINTSTRATDLADAILSDLKDPPFLQEVQIPNFWPVQLGDYLKLEANDVHYDTDQYGSVNHIRHEITGGQMMTTLNVGGQPKGHYTSWIDAPFVVPRNLPAPQGTVAIAADGGVAVSINGPDWVSSYKYATSTSAFPSLATARAGTSANGQSITFTLSAATLDLGDTIYITAIPFALTGGKGYEGPAVQLENTRHDFATTKDLSVSAMSLLALDTFSASRYGVTSGYVGIKGYTPADGGANVAFASMLELPDGVTLTGFSANVYSEVAAPEYVDARIDSLDASGGFTTIFEDTSANTGWEVISDSGSESTTGKRYRFIVGFLGNQTGGAFGLTPDGATRISDFTITYDMPSSANAI